MFIEYGRYLENALGEYNYNFMQRKWGKPVDAFFANFNWGKSEVDCPSVQLNGFIGILTMLLAGLRAPKEALIRLM